MELSIMKSLVFLAFSLQLASAATHSLQYIDTAVTRGIDFPEFTEVGLLDGEEFVYYDSVIGKMIPKVEWIKEVVDTDYWNRNTQNAQGSQESFKVNVDILIKRFNQTGGIHTVQGMYGCEVDDHGIRRGYRQYGYDGEDYLSLDLNTLTWTAPNPQAVITKNNWEVTLGGAPAKRWKNYLENTCIEWLQKYVEYGKSTLERKVSPKMELFQKDSTSPVVCHATGFFPKEVMISWQKNGADHDEDVELRELLQNQDGTFQKRSVLTVSPEELEKNQYSCVIQHSSLEKERVMQVSDRRILSGGESVGIIVGAIVAVLLLLTVAACVGVVIWKKKKDGFKPVPGNPSARSEGDSSSNNS